MRQITNLQTTDLARHGRALQLSKATKAEELLCLILYLPFLAILQTLLREFQNLCQHM